MASAVSIHGTSRTVPAAMPARLSSAPMSCEIAAMSPAVRTLPTETPSTCGADDGFEIGLDPLRVERVDARQHGNAGRGEARQPRANRLAGVRLLGGRHGVLHVGYERIGFEGQRLLEHARLVAGHEQQATKDHVAITRVAGPGFLNLGLAGAVNPSGAAAAVRFPIAQPPGT